MGMFPTKNTVLKGLLFACVFFSMMMWRRLQLAACKEHRMLNHMAQISIQGNISVHYDASLDLTSSKKLEHKGPLSEYFDKINHQKSKAHSKDSNDYDINKKIWASTDVLFDLSDSVKSEFLLTLSVKADSNKTVILSIVDTNLQEFALNFYIQSLQRHSITNFVYVCLDTKAQKYLQIHGISCLLYELENSVSDKLTETEPKEGDFGSNQYYIKTNVKTLFVLEALKSNYQVLISDVDVIYFKNPLTYLSCEGCDLMVSKDREYWNTGFAFVKPTQSSQLLYMRTWKLYNHYHLSHDQAYLHMARKTMQQDNIQLQALELPARQFPCGYYYFEEKFREFANQPPCDHCIIAHNNYMGSSDAKRYRFQENLLWMVDTYGYYSNASTKYLTYANPLFVDKETYNVEIQALQSALLLGLLLQRVVILPQFHCCDCKTKKCYSEWHKCSLLHMLEIKTFEEFFSGQYREHVFLSHKLVPTAIKNSKFAHIEFKNQQVSFDVFQTKSNYSVDSFDMSDTNSLLKEDFREWIKKYDNVPVLYFESLYGDISGLAYEDDLEYFDKLKQSAFRCAEYEQWQVKPFV